MNSAWRCRARARNSYSIGTQAAVDTPAFGYHFTWDVNSLAVNDGENGEPRPLRLITPGSITANAIARDRSPFYQLRGNSRHS